MEIQSEEGTTQGDPIAMPIYAVSILPLLTSIIVDDKASRITNLKQAAFADDLVGAGSLASLKFWWDAILRYGPYIGYEAKASKSWLIIKEEYENCARELFYGSDLNITVKGKKHLGAIIGSEEFKKEYVEELIDDWCKELNTLSEIALIEPHAAYASYIHGFQHKFTYAMRTIPGIEVFVKRLDDIITNDFIRNLFNRSCTDLERELFSLMHV